MKKVRVKAHKVKENGWIPDQATDVEFEGRLLVEYNGFRGETVVYRAKHGYLNVVYDHTLFPEKVLQTHTNLTDVAEHTEGYTKDKHPRYDQGLIDKIAEALGEEVPIKNLDRGGKKGWML